MFLRSCHDIGCESRSHAWLCPPQTWEAWKCLVYTNSHFWFHRNGKSLHVWMKILSLVAEGAVRSHYLRVVLLSTMPFLLLLNQYSSVDTHGLILDLYHYILIEVDRKKHKWKIVKSTKIIMSRYKPWEIFTPWHLNWPVSSKYILSENNSTKVHF